MNIKSLLNPTCCVAQIDASSKKRVLENLAKLFSETVEDLDEIEVYQQLLNRERLGSTGIGSGIGIPHCRIANASKTYGACITLKQPVDFNASDNQPVDVIFAMLVPDSAENAHLETLAALVEVLQKPNFVKQLRDTHHSEEVYNMMVSAFA